MLQNLKSDICFKADMIELIGIYFELFCKEFIKIGKIPTSSQMVNVVSKYYNEMNNGLLTLTDKQSEKFVDICNREYNLVVLEHE